MSALDGFGVQFTDLPPRGRSRLTDYSATFVYFFRDSSARVTQAGIEVALSFIPNALITQAGIEVVVGFEPSGDQLSGNTPDPKPRARDYTWFNPGAGASVISTVPPTPAPGLSTLLSDNVPPRAAARLRDYTFTNAGEAGPLNGQDKLNPGQSSQIVDNLPPKAAARARDYTHVSYRQPGLVDASNAGSQVFDLPPKAALRLSDYTVQSAFPIIYLTAPPPPNPRFQGGQSTDLTALPTPAAPRARDYSFASWRFQGLIDQAIPGSHLYDLPPRGAARMRDYSFTYAFPVQFPPAGPQPPLGTGNPFAVRLTDLPPYGPKRLIEYPALSRTSLALLANPPVSTETFQAMLFI